MVGTKIRVFVFPPMAGWASAGAAAEARRARLSAADSATRFSKFTRAYAGVLCSAVLFGRVASGCGWVKEGDEAGLAATERAPLMLPAPKAAAAKRNVVPFSASSSLLSSLPSTSSPPAPLSTSAQERWAAAAADAAFGHGMLAAASSSSSSTSSIVRFSSASDEHRRQRRRRDDGGAEEEGEDDASSSSSDAPSDTTAAAFAFLGVLPFGLLPFLRRGSREER